MSVRRIVSKWAGLRVFAPDKALVAGFDPTAENFFWLAGQGGYGFQTAPAMADAATSLIAGTPWPAGLAGLGVDAATISPDRLRGG